jgi:hypothetical protein
MGGLLGSLPAEIEHHAEKILRDIEESGSMIAVVKNGAKAEGFVLGVRCGGGLSAEDCEALSVHFDHATEKRLRSLTRGL